MKRFKITLHETWIRTVEVKAESEEVAMEMLDEDEDIETDMFAFSHIDATDCEEIEK